MDSKYSMIYSILLSSQLRNRSKQRLHSQSIICMLGVGRPQTTRDDIPAIFYKHYPTYLAGQMNVSELARVCGLSRPTIYKYIKMLE